MKKVFVEPEMQKIELNLRENIAASVDENSLVVHFATAVYMCPVVDTGHYAHEVFDTEEHKQQARNCFTYGRARSIGSAPMEDVIRHVRG